MIWPRREWYHLLIMKVSLLPLGLLFALAGCTTRSEVRNLPSDAGSLVVYKAPFEKTRTAARDALAEAGFSVKDDMADGAKWRLLASQGLGAGTVGRIARVMLENRRNETAVWVLVRGKVESKEAGTTDDALASEIHRKLAARLK